MLFWHYVFCYRYHRRVQLVIVNTRVALIRCVSCRDIVCPKNKRTQRLLIRPFSTWWRHQMETLSALLALCAFTGHPWIPLTKASDAELWFFSLICAWTNGWANNRNAAELRRHGAHYDVIVVTSMDVLLLSKCFSPSWTQREYRRICSHNGAGILFMNTNFKLTFAFFFSKCPL